MMKKILFALLCCLLLLGCRAQEQPTETTAATIPTETQVLQPEGFYDPDSPLEAATNGALRCYPLGITDYSGMISLSDNLLLFTCDESTVKLTVFAGETLFPVTSRQFDCPLFPQDACLRRWQGGISFYHSTAREILVLDEQLRDVSRIPAPEDLVGAPLLSYDRKTVYYFTDTALRALELDTGISRLLKEMSYEYQEISGLLLDETVLACSILDEKDWEMLYLSTETGEILDRREDMLLPETVGNRYYAPVWDSSVVTHVFGSTDSSPRVLNPKDADCTVSFLPERYAAITVPTFAGNDMTLRYYDLETALCTSAVTLGSEFYPWCFSCTADGAIWFMNFDEHYDCTTLYRWDPSLSPTEDLTCYGGVYFTPEKPDQEGLERCEAYAREIGEKYGVEVLIYKDATDIQPYDYDLEPEHLVGVIQRELELLDRNLSRYPDGFLQKLASRFQGLNICIVRSLNGSAESGSLNTADGIQFMHDYTAYIALAAPCNTEYALYHEMCHLIDTMVISESGAYDRWDQLNPKDFEYDYDYIANLNRDDAQYLEESSRSFIDTYSMSFPKEDRARIMEYAMTEGNEAYFRSTTMQSKLLLLCEGIREAFGLRKSPETFLWEQYLNVSLAYTD